MAGARWTMKRCTILPTVGVEDSSAPCAPLADHPPTLERPMTHHSPCSTTHFLSLATLLFGLLAGLAVSDTSAAPPAPVAPIITSAATRFTDNGNGTVTDSITGLVWLKNASCFAEQSWSNALLLANSLASPNCGLSDGSTAGQWRLPNRNELQSLIDYTQFGPALPVGHPFTGIRSNYYWTSTTSMPRTSYAVTVPPGSGIVTALEKTTSIDVSPVRDQQ